MAKRIGILGGLALIALVLVTFTGSALAAPPSPTPGPSYYGFGFLDRVTLQRVADVLGTTANDVAAQVQQGQTLAQIAQAKGVSEKALTDAILQPIKDRLALQVKYGYLTQGQADTRLQYEEVRVKELISTTPGSYGDNGYGYGGGCHGGWGGFGSMMGSAVGYGRWGMMGWW